MHRVLQRQLKKLGLSAEEPPSPEAWAQFVQRVSNTYKEGDQDRYLLERSLSISSREMQEIYDQLLASSESRIAAERDKLRAVISSLGAGLCTLDVAGRVLSINPEGERLLDCAEADVLGEAFFAWPRPADTPPVPEVIATGQPYRAEDGAFTRRDGSVLPVSYTLNPIIEDGALRGAVLVFIDITERKRAEAALAESEKTYRTLVQNAHVCIHELDLQGRLTSMNPAGLRMLGLRDQREVYGRAYLDLVAPQDRARIAGLLERAGEGQASEFEFAGSAADAPRRYASSFIPLRRADGTVQRLMGIIRDITERKRAEEALRESEQRFRELFESSPDAIFVENFDGDVLDANPAACQLQGLPYQQLVGRNVRALVPPDERQQALDNFARMVSGDLDRLEGSSWTADGRAVPVEISVSHIMHDQQPALLLQVRDITARRNAEQRLRLLEASVSASLDGITISDVDQPDTPLVYASPGFTRMTGYAEAEVLGRNCRFLQRDDRDQAALPEIRAALAEGRQCRVVLRNYRKDGARFWNELTLYPLRDAGGRLTHYVGIQRDVTERKQAEQELARINAELEQRNRALQDFAYVASHDLQEPLRKIRAFANLMKEDYDAQVDETGRYYLDRMQDAATRMAGLITDLLAYSRVTTKARPFDKVDLNATAAEVLSDLEVQISETEGCVEIHDLPTIEADPTQMRQLLQNFIGNALKFHKPGERPRVEIRAAVEAGNGASDAPSHPVCRLEVQDNGIGFDEKYLDRIFTPFQRLHNRGRYAGTGMGLAICRRIAERHHGAITARSAPGEGATFIVTLPVHQSNTSEEEEAA